MSGTGKSSVIEELKRRGLTAVDTDSDEWCEWILEQSDEEPSEPDWVWREDRMLKLLTEPRDAPLFVSGCKSNQGKFYDHFDQIVLLSAPLEVMLDRIEKRTNNPYGKRPEERDQIVDNLRDIEPLLRRGATVEFDTSKIAVSALADRLVSLASSQA